ncbi:MAG: ArnT family glycosyltransferase [Actinomycetota bacterium]
MTDLDVRPDGSGSHRVPGSVRGGLLGLGVFVAMVLLGLDRPVNVRDEVWLLWLSDRVGRGEVMYRDAYNVTTPLAAWILAGLVRVFGTEVLVLRLATAAVLTAEVLVGLAVVRRLGMRVGGQVVFVLALCAVATPAVAWISLYSALAVLGGLVALAATLAWVRDGSTRAPFVVGVAGALSVLAKPNVGALAAVALLVTAVVLAARADPTRRRAVMTDVGRMAATALGVCVVAAVVVGAGGAGPAFVDQVFRSKGAYLDVGFGYGEALRNRIDILLDGTVPRDGRLLLRTLVQATPVVVVPLLVWGAVRARRAPAPVVVALVASTVAGLLAVLPRPGINHFAGVLPWVATGLAGVWTVALRSRPAGNRAARVARPVLAAGAVVAALAVVAAVGPLVGPERRAEYGWNTAHFVGAPLRGSQAGSAARLGAALRARGVDTVFIAREDAGFLYLRTGTTNPLPYDYVERSDLGHADEPGVIARLRRGEAEWVCLHPPRPPAKADDPLVPRRLEAWVRAEFEPVAELPRCDLYRAPAAGSAGGSARGSAGGPAT